MYFKFMNANYDNNDEKTGEGEHASLKGYILSAIDMEENFTNSVYRDYLKPGNWPGGLNEKTFRKIETCLLTLIKDTEKHITRLFELKRKLTL